jgi:TRAP transporter 4TM/12TM fusion protein
LVAGLVAVKMMSSEKPPVSGWMARGLGFLAGALGLALSAVALHIAAFGVANETWTRVGAYTLALAIAIVFSLSEAPGGRRGVGRRIVDAAMLVGLLLSTWRYLAVGHELEEGLYSFTQSDLAYGVVGLIVLTVLTWRAFGPPLVVVTAIATGYALFGSGLPGIMRHGGYSLEQYLQVVWYSFDGVFGGPLTVVVTVILVYVIFGVILETVGAGRTLLKLSLLLTGRLRGGPAHAAVVASGMFGTVSGSVVANVVGTGVMTMPMIKERGFSARFAGAVEAAASTGGQIMPPVMGVVAFVMADVTGIPYLTIAIAALVPALFYYASLVVSVHIEACKLGIEPLPASARPVLDRRDIGLTFAFALPLATIVVLMVMGRSPAFAGLVAVILAVVIGFLVNPDFRRRPLLLLHGLAMAGQQGARIVIAVASIGIVIGVMNMTGLGLRFATVVQALAGNHLFLALLLTALASLVLGLGLPTVPAYLVIVIVMGPAISALGDASILTVHLFVVYFAVLSAVTPPVAIAAFAAAPIAGASPIAIGIDAIRLSMVGFVIPFLIVEAPSLTLVQGFVLEEFVWAAARLAVGIWFITTGLSGFSTGVLGWPERAARLVIAALTLSPGVSVEIFGFAASTIFIARDFTGGALASRVSALFTRGRIQ